MTCIAERDAAVDRGVQTQSVPDEGRLHVTNTGNGPLVSGAKLQIDVGTDGRTSRESTVVFTSLSTNDARNFCVSASFISRALHPLPLLAAMLVARS